MQHGRWKLVGRRVARNDGYHPAGWELYDLVKDPDELNNVYDDPGYEVVRDQLKLQFAELRKQIGDNGSHYPECEEVVQEFWDYDRLDQQKAIAISREFKTRREASLRTGNSPGKKKPKRGKKNN